MAHLVDPVYTAQALYLIHKVNLVSRFTIGICMTVYYGGGGGGSGRSGGSVFGGGAPYVGIRNPFNTITTQPKYNIRYHI